MTAMTAATLDLMSGGRFLLGLGTSGPGVAEGWHGQPFGKPIGRTREYVEIVRAALRREPLEHHGEHYDIPHGEHRALKLMARPLRADVPIYLAAIGPRNVALAVEIADGWLPIWISPERLHDVFGEHARRRAGRLRRRRVLGSRCLDDDLQAARDSVKPTLALYVGGMGEFYNALVGRYGYEAEGREDPASSTSAGRSSRRSPRCRMRSSTRSRSSGRASGSPTGSTHGASRA